MFILTAIKLFAAQSGILGFFAGRIIPGLEPFKEKFFFAASDNQFEPALQMFERVRNITGFLIAGIIVISVLADLPSYIADWKSAIGNSGKRYLVCTLFFVGYSAIIFPLPLWIGQGLGTAIDPDWFATGEIMRRINTYVQPTTPTTPPGTPPGTPPSPTPPASSGNWYANLVGWAMSLPTTGVTAIFMVLCYLIFFIVIAVICAVWLTFVVVLYVIGPIFICLGFIKGFGEKMLANYGGALIQCALWPVWMAICNAMVKNSILTQLQYTLQPGGTENSTVGSAMISIQMVSYCAVFMVLYGMTPVVANMIFPLSSFGQMMGMVAKKATDAATMGAGLAIGAATGGTGLAPLLGGKAFMGAKAGASLTQQAGSSLASKAVSGLSSMSKSEITGAGSKLDGFDMKGANFGKATETDFSNLYKKGLSSFEGGGQEYLRDLAEGKTENLPSFEEAVKNGFSPETAKAINESLAANERVNGASSVRMFGANPESVPTYTESLKNGYGDNFQQQKIGEIESLENNWNSMSKEERSQAMRALPTYNQALRQQNDARGASTINKNRQVLESQGKMPPEDYAVKTTKDGGLVVSTPRSVMSLGSDGSVSKESRASFEKNVPANTASKTGGRSLSSLEPGERGYSAKNGNVGGGATSSTGRNLTSLNVGDREESAAHGSGASNQASKSFSYPVSSQTPPINGNSENSTDAPAANRSFVLNNKNDSQQEKNSGSNQGTIVPGVMGQGSGHSAPNQASAGNNSGMNSNPILRESEESEKKTSINGNGNNTFAATKNEASERSNFVSGSRAGNSSYETNQLPPIEKSTVESSPFIMQTPIGRDDGSAKDSSRHTGIDLSDSTANKEGTAKKFEGGTAYSEDNLSVVPPATNTMFNADEDNSATPMIGGFTVSDQNTNSKNYDSRSNEEDYSKKFDGGKFDVSEIRQENSFIMPGTKEALMAAISEADNRFVNNKTSAENEPFIFGVNDAENMQQAFTRQDYSSPFEDKTLGNPLRNEVSGGNRALNEDSKRTDSKSGKLLNLNDESPKSTIKGNDSTI